MMKSLCIAFISLLFIVSANTTFAQAGKDEALTTLGSATGLLLYNTYIGIGAIADGYVGDVYDSSTVAALMEEQVGSLESVKTEFNKLLGSGFLSDASDQAYATEVVAALGLLVNEATAFQSYCATGSDDDADDYDDARTAAWDKISEMLGLE